MEDDLVAFVEASGPEGIYGALALVLARPVGLLFGFQAFMWAISTSTMIRIGIGAALAAPTLVLTLPSVEALVVAAQPLPLARVGAQELVLGFALGLLGSLPFFSLQYAGAITDAFRGESDGGQPDPSGGGTLQTTSTFYLVIGFGLFFAAGGLWALVALFYRSYIVWPLGVSLPGLDPSSVNLVLALLADTLVASIRLALPLLALMVTIEVGLWVAARLARRMGLYDLAFPAKNLAMVLTLPLTAWLIQMGVGDLTDNVLVISDLLSRLLPFEGP